MAIVGNRFYNNPAIGAAASGLANLFRPPDVSALPDVMTARAKKQEADRIAQLFTMAGDPNVNMDILDRKSVIANIYDPTSSWSAQNQNDATARYRVGVESSDRLYGFDTQAATSRANNAADNARALRLGELESSDRRYASDTQAATSQANNAADNARALRIGELGIVAAPLSEGQMRMLPADFAEAYGVPAEQRGLVKVNEGQNAVLSDGTVYRGQAKPLSMDQTTARNAQRLYDDEAWRRFIGSGINVEMAVGEDGNPVFVARSDSFGKRPFVQPGSTAASRFTNVTVEMEDGTKMDVLGVFDPTTKEWSDSQGQPLPGRVVKAYELQGQDSLGNLNAGASANNRALATDQQVNRTIDTIDKMLDLVDRNNSVAGIIGRATGFAQNLAATLGEVGAALEGKAIPIDELRNIITERAGSTYNPDIPAYETLAFDLTYQLIKANDPQGEVNVREFERQYNEVMGFLSNAESARAKLGQYREQMLANKRFNGSYSLRRAGSPDSLPMPGDIVDGHMYIGTVEGDRGDPSNWKKVAR